ncbi:MAG: hypothetical protein KAR19_14020 [Bacteroidales bacterium]|nr:hypothetical protein [Bacteroidales bacterium]
MYGAGQDCRRTPLTWTSLPSLTGEMKATWITTGRGNQRRHSAPRGFNMVSSFMVIKVDFDLTISIRANNLYRIFAL